MIECKGKSPGGTVSLEEVTDRLGKLPIVQDYVASREHLRERNQTYAFWTTGAFEADALDKLKSEQAHLLPSLTSLRALVDFDHRVYLRHVPEDVLEVEERAFR